MNRKLEKKQAQVFTGYFNTPLIICQDKWLVSELFDKAIPRHEM